MLTVSDDQSPVMGMSIDIPDDAYPSALEVTVSTSDIKKNTIYPDLKIITPLITVENGGAYSDSLMIVKIPCTIPEGKIPLPFFYDADTHEIEFIQLLDFDNTSVTFGVTHFSHIAVGIVEKYLGKENANVDTGFTPGQDDFSFANEGSAITPGGQCMGQSLAAVWYFENLKAKNGPLYFNYDNYGKNPDITFQTSDFQYDDVMAYRLAAVTQTAYDQSFDNYIGDIFIRLKIPDQIIFDSLSAIMQLTQSPQLFSIYEISADRRLGRGHVIIAYKILDNKIYVADPNWPGDTTRTIEIVDGKFKGYSSGNNTLEIQAGQKKIYEYFSIVNKSTFENFHEIGIDWLALEQRTVGDALFPEFNYVIEEVTIEDGNNTYVSVKEGHQTKNKEISLITSHPVTLCYINSENMVKKMPINQNGYWGISLSPGENRIGVYEYKVINSLRWWHNFKWIRIILEDEDGQKTYQNNNAAVIYNGNYNVTAQINLTSDYPLSITREVINKETIALEIAVDVSEHPVKMTLNASVSDPTFTDLKAGLKVGGYIPVVKELYWDSNSQGKVSGTSLTFEIPKGAINGDSCSLVMVIDDFNEKSDDRIWGGSGKLVYILFVPQ